MGAGLSGESAGGARSGIIRNSYRKFAFVIYFGIGSSLDDLAPVVSTLVIPKWFLNTMQGNSDQPLTRRAPKKENDTARRPPGRRPLAEGSAQDTRRNIRRCAMPLFNERGYASVSLDDIAQAAGLTRATLYYHYSSKSEIFVEGVMATAEFVNEQIKRVVNLRDLTVRERLERMVRYRREAGVAWEPGAESGEEVNEKMVEETLPHLAPEQRGRIVAAFKRIHEPTRALIVEGIERGELRDLPPDVIKYMFWQIFEPNEIPGDVDMSRQELDAHLLSLFFRGILK